MWSVGGKNAKKAYMPHISSKIPQKLKWRDQAKNADVQTMGKNVSAVLEVRLDKQIVLVIFVCL